MAKIIAASAWKLVSRDIIDTKAFTLGEGAAAKTVRFRKMRKVMEGWHMNAADIVEAMPGGIGRPAAGIPKDDPGLHATLAFILDNIDMAEEDRQALRESFAEAARG